MEPLVPPSKPTRDDYERSWRRLTNLGRLVTCVFAVAIVANTAVAVAALEYVPYAWSVSCVLLLVVSSRWAYHRCPRCFAPFHYRQGVMLRPFRRHCVHCALPKGFVPDAD